MYEAPLYKKPNGNLVKVTLNNFRDTIYVHIRDYQMDGDSGYWYPTKTGYSFFAEEIDTIIKGLSEVSEAYAKYCRQQEFLEEQLEFNFEEEE